MEPIQYSKDLYTFEGLKPTLAEIINANHSTPLTITNQDGQVYKNKVFKNLELVYLKYTYAVHYLITQGLFHSKVYQQEGVGLSVDTYAQRVGVRKPVASFIFNTLKENGIIQRVKKHSFNRETRYCKASKYKLTEHYEAKLLNDTIKETFTSEHYGIAVLRNLYQVDEAYKAEKSKLNEGETLSMKTWKRPKKTNTVKAKDAIQKYKEEMTPTPEQTQTVSGQQQTADIPVTVEEFQDRQGFVEDAFIARWDDKTRVVMCDKTDQTSESNMNRVAAIPVDVVAENKSIQSPVIQAPSTELSGLNAAKNARSEIGEDGSTNCSITSTLQIVAEPTNKFSKEEAYGYLFKKLATITLYEVCELSLEEISIRLKIIVTYDETIFNCDTSAYADWISAFVEEELVPYKRYVMRQRQAA